MARPIGQRRLRRKKYSNHFCQSLKSCRLVKPTLPCFHEERVSRNSARALARPSASAASASSSRRASSALRWWARVGLCVRGTVRGVLVLSSACACMFASSLENGAYIAVFGDI